MVDYNNKLKMRILNDIIDGNISIGYVLRDGISQLLNNDFLSPGKKDDVLVHSNTVALEIGSRCDGKCKNCYAENKDKKIHLSEESIKKIMLYSAMNNVNYISVIGGEPFHISNEEVLLNMIKEYKQTTFVAFTSGKPFAEGDVLDRMKKINNLSVMFSVDGPKEINDYLRGEKAYETSVFAMQKYKSKLKKPFGVSVTLSNDNFLEATSEKFLLEMCNNGAYLLSFAPCYSKEKGYLLDSVNYQKSIIRLMSLHSSVPAVIVSTQFGQLYDSIDIIRRPRPVLVDCNGNVKITREEISGDLNDQLSLINIIGTRQFQNDFVRKHQDFENYESLKSQPLVYETLSFLKDICDCKLK